MRLILSTTRSKLRRRQGHTLGIEGRLPVVAPGLECMVEAPAGRWGRYAVLDLESITELEEVAARATVKVEALPREEVLLNCRHACQHDNPNTNERALATYVLQQSRRCERGPEDQTWS